MEVVVGPPEVATKTNAAPSVSDASALLSIRAKPDFTRHETNPIDRHDALTNCPTKILISSHQGCEKLHQHLGSSIYSWAFDLRSVGHVSKTGPEGEKLVDKYLASLRSIVGLEISLHLGEHVPWELVRRGGDEFVLLIGAEQEKRSDVLKCFNSISDTCADHKKRLFAEQGEKGETIATTASALAKRRDLVNYYIDSYLEAKYESQNKLTLKDWMHERFDTNLIEQAESAAIFRGICDYRRALAHIADLKAREGITSSKNNLLGFKGGVAHLELKETDRLTPSTLLGTISLIDEYIAFGGSGKTDLSCDWLSSEYVEEGVQCSEHDQKTIEHSDSMLATWREIYAHHNDSYFPDLVYVAATDPACTGVVRHGPLVDVRVGILDDRASMVSQENPYNMLWVEIVGFGAINKYLGYDLADQIFSQIVNEINIALQHSNQDAKYSFAIRTDGGRILIMGTENFSDDSLGQLAASLTEQLSSLLHTSNQTTEDSLERAMLMFAVERAFVGRSIPTFGSVAIKGFQFISPLGDCGTVVDRVRAEWLRSVESGEARETAQVTKAKRRLSGGFAVKN